MSTNCPHCASTLDVPEAFCSRCGWNAPYLIRRTAPRQSEMTYAQRYRGTNYDPQPRVAVAPERDGAIARGRLFVIVSFASLTTVAVTVVLAQPPM